MKSVLLIAAAICVWLAFQTTKPPQPYTPEQYRDLARQAVEYCRLPHGDRNRPSKQICGY